MIEPRTITPQPSEPPSLAASVVEFARRASTEISTHDEERLASLAPVWPEGVTVYIAHTPKSTLEDIVRVARKARSLGIRVSPHIVARRISGMTALRQALAQLSAAGVDQLLLIAGDLSAPVGEFANTLQIIESGVLADFGFKSIGVAGHPDGHRSISSAALLSALRHKQEFASRSGSRVHIVTQFGFDADAICAWARQLSVEGVALPVHVGIAGPTPLPKLLKFALQCGVGNSMNSMMANLGAMTNLARQATTPDEMLLGIVRGSATDSPCNIVQPHFYAFGGTMATATWLRAVADGKFTVQPDGSKLIVNA